MEISLALGVAGDALAVAAELRVVAGQQDEAGEHPGAELVEHRAVAPVAVDLPVRRHRAEVDDPGVGPGWLVDGRVTHRRASLPATGRGAAEQCYSSCDAPSDGS